MASGHVNRVQQAEHMAAPTNAAFVKKVLANSEPSTHGLLHVVSRLRSGSVPFGAKRKSFSAYPKRMGYIA